MTQIERQPSPLDWMHTRSRLETPALARRMGAACLSGREASSRLARAARGISITG